MKEKQEKKKRGNPGTPDWIVNKVWALKREKLDQGAPAIHSILKQYLEKIRQGDLLPTPRTVQNIINRRPAERATMIESSPLDKPWSFGSLVQYHVTADALPTVEWFYRISLASNSDITIRQVLWLSRLYKMMLSRLNVSPFEETYQQLYEWACVYAEQERIWEEGLKLSPEADKYFDTRDLDIAILKGIKAQQLLSALTEEKGSQKEA